MATYIYTTEEINQQLNDDTCDNVLLISTDDDDKHIAYIKSQNHYIYVNNYLCEFHPNVTETILNNDNIHIDETELGFWVVYTDSDMLEDGKEMYYLMLTIYNNNWTLPQINDWIESRDFVLK